MLRRHFSFEIKRNKKSLFIRSGAFAALALAQLKINCRCFLIEMDADNLAYEDLEEKFNKSCCTTFHKALASKPKKCCRNFQKLPPFSRLRITLIRFIEAYRQIFIQP